MSAVLLALSVIAVPTPYPGVEPLPPATTMRLDESADLFTLTPFRHAAGQRYEDLYARSPHTSWIRRAWFGLDWELALPDAVLDGDDPPIHPRPRCQPPRDPVAARLLAARVAWPLTAEEGWFLAHDERGPELLPPLAVDDDVVPAWLRRLDPHFASAFVSIAGCGRGGDCPLGVPFPAEPFVTLFTEPEPPPSRCLERPARVLGYGGEQEVFYLLRCDGSVPPGALDRLSILARPPGVEHPGELPLEPSPDASRGEWVPGVKMLHPRLLWVLHRIAVAYPWKAVYIYSGYRRPDGDGGPGSHKSQHHEGRAIDIKVDTVSNEDLLALCWELPDLGCGYYPHNKFVHIDIRPRGTGHGVWVDVSEAGQPSRYVYEWPGVVERGRVIHDRRR